MDLKAYIRDVPDFPSPGILFRDITPLLKDTAAFKYVIERVHHQYADRGIDVVVAVEARGFLFGAPLAHIMGIPLAISRKQGKLPFESINTEYELEYGHRCDRDAQGCRCSRTAGPTDGRFAGHGEVPWPPPPGWSRSWGVVWRVWPWWWSLPTSEDDSASPGTISSL